MDNQSGGVLNKVVTLLDILAESGPLPPAALIARTGYARPTVYRLLGLMEQHGLVFREPEGPFRLSLRLLRWGRQAAATLDLVKLSRPILAALNRMTGESVQLFIREGSVRVCAAAVELAAGLRDTVPVGSRLPLTRGSAGKIFMAHDVMGSLAQELTPEERDRIQHDGWAESVAEREPGVASVSAAIKDAAGMIRAAICISGPVSRLGEHPGQRLAQPVRIAANLIEAALAGRDMVWPPGWREKNPAAAPGFDAP